jgi:hypothetical protein
MQNIYTGYRFIMCGGLSVNDEQIVGEGPADGRRMSGGSSADQISVRLDLKKSD